MPIDHQIQQGEHLSVIADQYGFRDYRTIWNDPLNADLRKLRDSPNVLFPGDTLRIPDKLKKKDSAPTGQTTRYQVPGQPLYLRLALRDFGNEPLVDTECKLQVEGKSISVKTDGDGHVSIPISRTAREATLIFKDPFVPFELSVPIKIGYLDPVEEVSGQKARLSNLGYITRPLEEVDDTVFARSVQEFQCDYGLTVIGECDSDTQDKLKQVHGS